MITFKHSGDFKKTERYLRRVQHLSLSDVIRSAAEEGVDALRRSTPKDTGKTANSWYYEIYQTKNSIKIEWKNSNIINKVPIAIILQYGHATRTGGYVEGIDYINPAMRPVFDKISETLRKELAKN